MITGRVLTAVVGVALYLTVAGLTGVALGALLCNTAAAITTFVGVFFVIPPLTLLLPASWSGRFLQYLPANAGAMLVAGTDGVSNPCHHGPVSR
jgi:ABC-2 type transport system permease protein